MKKLKSKAFFIKSAIIHIFLSIFVILISWQFFEPSAYNFMHKMFTARTTGSEDIVLIVIDDKSIEQYRWPWQRDLYAEIFEYLDKYSNPKIIAFDAILSSLDKEKPQADQKLFNTIKNIDNLVVGFSPLIQDYPPDINGEEYSQKFDNKFKININDSAYSYNYSKYRSLSRFPVPYFNSIKYTGSVNTTPNSSGYITLGDQIVNVNGKKYPSLGLRMYMLLNNTDTISLYKNKILVDETNLTIPALYTRDGIQNYTRYYKTLPNSEYSHKKYSAIDVINSARNIKQGKKPVIDPKEFDGKTVFVGANAKASALGLEDALPTPILQKHPGVDIQATNLDNLINNQFVRQTTILQDLTLLFALSVIVFVLIAKLSFFESLGILILIALGYIAFSAVCFMHGIAPNVITPLAIQLVTMIFGYSFRFILEGRNKEKIKQAMGKYLSQDIMQNVVKNIDDIKLGGKKAVVTVLFADIRGFTSISEKLTAEEVSMILNEYFTAIEPIISKYNGVINKFIGDAVMAIFGEPIQDINHARNAVLCANEMLKKVDELRDKWLFEGKPKIEIGIGINTGEAFVGNIGSEKRLEYTVIGDMVNLASRIESYNKVYKTNLLISSSTYSHVSSIADVIKISEVTIRGKSKKMDIYEVLRLT